MIYLENPDLYLETILGQEGVPVTDDKENAAVFVYLKDNQLLLSSAPNPNTELKNRSCPVKFITANNFPYFHNLQLVDINCRCDIPANANLGHSDRGLSFVYYDGGETMVIPCSPFSTLRHRGYQTKKFYTRQGRCPDETVARVDRGGVRRLIAACLRMFFNQKNLPYIHLSYVPAGCKSVFGFRIDTDYTPIKIIKKCLSIPESFGMSWTWFIMTSEVTVNEAPIWAAVLSNQDVQLHCHYHVVYPDIKRNITNYYNGLEKMRLMNLIPSGVAAPYGEWHRAIATAFAKLGFTYSSEFCYAYDDLPSRPVIDGTFTPVLQVPVHPVSLGRLIAAGMNEDAMIEYYKNIIDLQVARNEPCFLYDHPLTIIRFPRVIKAVVEYGIHRCGRWMSMTQFTDWWTKREKSKYQCRVSEQSLEIDVTEPNSELELVIELNEFAARVPYVSGKYSLTTLNWKPVEKKPCPADIAKIRYETPVWKLKNHLRLLRRQLRDLRILRKNPE
ncbi:MAG: hypothetical protein ABIK48_03880 [candidate division WOR-3 bacterium]